MKTLGIVLELNQQLKPYCEEGPFFSINFQKEIIGIYWHREIGSTTRRFHSANNYKKIIASFQSQRCLCNENI